MQAAFSGSPAAAFARAARLNAQHGQPRWRPDRAFGWVVTLAVWTLVVLMIVPDNFDYSGLGSAGAPAAGGAVSRMLWLALVAGGLAVIALRQRLAVALWHELNPWLLVFAALAAASVVWSIEPGYTLRRLIRVAAFVVDAFALALLCWHRRRFQNLLRPIVTLMLAGSLAFGLLAPQLAIHQETAPELLGAWRGLANHKNSFGALACLGILLWAHAWLAREVRGRAALLGCAVAAACLLLSRSSTARLATLLALGLLVMLQRCPRGLRPYRAHCVVVFVGAVLLYALATLDLIPGAGMLLQPIAALAGKDTSMTGRSEIWDILCQQIGEHPWLGTGYGAYWTGVHADSPSYVFIRQMGFYPGSAHNGYLEIVNELGIAGAVCLGGFLLVWLRQALALLRVDADQGALYLALFLQEAVVNLSESHWFSVLSVNFAVIVLATAALARGLLEVRLRRHFGEPDAAESPTLHPDGAPA